MTLNGEQLARGWVVKCLQVWINDGLTWKRQVKAVRKNCFCGHAKLRDVLPPMAKGWCIVLSPALMFTRVHKTGTVGLRGIQSASFFK